MLRLTWCRKRRRCSFCCRVTHWVLSIARHDTSRASGLNFCRTLERTQGGGRRNKWRNREGMVSLYSTYVYSPDIPVSSADFVQFTPWYWNSLYYGLISRG
jgi:hypothetical protein